VLILLKYDFLNDILSFLSKRKPLPHKQIAFYAAYAKAAQSTRVPLSYFSSKKIFLKKGFYLLKDDFLSDRWSFLSKKVACQPAKVKAPHCAFRPLCPL
jgi:hypothetical protein